MSPPSSAFLGNGVVTLWWALAEYQVGAKSSSMGISCYQMEGISSTQGQPSRCPCSRAPLHLSPSSNRQRCTTHDGVMTTMVPKGSPLRLLPSPQQSPSACHLLTSRACQCHRGASLCQCHYGISLCHRGCTSCSGRKHSRRQNPALFFPILQAHLQPRTGAATYHRRGRAARSAACFILQPPAGREGAVPPAQGTQDWGIAPGKWKPQDC